MNTDTTKEFTYRPASLTVGKLTLYTDSEGYFRHTTPDGVEQKLHFSEVHILCDEVTDQPTKPK